MQTFTALDFETANAQRNSVCAVGMVRVENGEITKQIHQLIKPDTFFSYRNTLVHSITEFDVRDAPNFPDFWGEMQPYLCDTVVAHNAAFDISCLRATIDFYGLAPIDFKYACTCLISKKIMKLPRNTLDYLADYFDLGAFRHHNALDDARICAELFNIFSKKIDIEPFKKDFIVKAKEKSVKVQKPQRSSSKIKEKLPVSAKPILQPELFEMFNLIDIKEVLSKKETKQLRSKISNYEDLEFDFSPIDFSKNFIVAGTFTSHSRKEIEGLILKNGGTVQRKPDSSTNYVVVGDIQTQDLRKGEYGTIIDTALNCSNAVFVTESHFFYCFL